VVGFIPDSKVPPPRSNGTRADHEPLGGLMTNPEDTNHLTSPTGEVRYHFTSPERSDLIRPAPARQNGPADPARVMAVVWDRLRTPTPAPNMTLHELLPVDPLADITATRQAMTKAANLFGGPS